MGADDLMLFIFAVLFGLNGIKRTEHLRAVAKMPNAHHALYTMGILYLSAFKKLFKHYYVTTLSHYLQLFSV